MNGMGYGNISTNAIPRFLRKTEKGAVMLLFVFSVFFHSIDIRSIQKKGD